jgi:hypothetical protein
VEENVLRHRSILNTSEYVTGEYADGGEIFRNVNEGGNPENTNDTLENK